MLRFRRLWRSSLYQGEATDPGSAGPNHGQMLFVLPSGTPILSGSLSLEEAWNFRHPSLGAGYFLFLQSSPPLDVGNEAEVDAFQRRVQSLLPRVVRNQHASLGWVTGNPADPASLQIQTLNIVQVDEGASSVRRTQNIPQAIRFQQIELMILPATPFGISSDQSSFVLQNTDYMAPPGADPHVTQPTNKRIYFRGAAAYNVDKVGETVTIPVWGADAGSLQFDLNDLNSVEIDPGVANLAMYYAVPEETLGRAQSLRYPMLNLIDPQGGLGPSSTISLAARLFPADQHRSIFQFGTGDSSSGPVVQTYFQTHHGYPVYLAPGPGAGFTFTHVPNPGVFPSRAAEVATHYALTPVGNFEMLLEEPPPDNEYARLIGGNSGTEYVSFMPRKNGTPGDMLCFFRDKPGFAPDFLRLVAENETRRRLQQTNGALLTDTFLTSWVSVQQSNGTPPQYYAQPDDAVLHGERVTDNPFLEYVEVPTTDLLQPPTDADCFPLVPLSGVIAPDERVSVPIGTDLYLLFEQKVMNPSRKDTISSVNPASHASPNGRSLLQAGQNTTTPQGMLVNVVGTDWQDLTLAKDDDEPTVNYLRFEDISAKFQDALSTNRLFMVSTRLSDLTEQGTTFTEDLLKVMGWPFQFEIGSAPNGLTEPDEGLGRENNVLLFKFANKTFDELIEDTRLWARAEEFNDSPTEIQAWLQEFIQDVRDKVAAGDEEDTALQGYTNLLAVIDDPNWHGILGLNVTVPPGELPCEVQPLLGGIRKLEEFKAHHVGFEIAKVTPSASDIDRSSIFGLIDYTDTGAVTQSLVRDQYEFIVLALKVVFANSEIKDFASDIRIVLTRLFDEDTGKLASGSWNYIDLVGTYKMENGKPSYTFATPYTMGPRHFDIVSDVGGFPLFDSVDISKVEFETGNCITDGQEGTVQASFLFLGSIKFANTFGFDFFSFDALKFSDLELRMEFPMAGDPMLPPIPPQNVFDFYPGNLRLDVSTSKSRADSLLSNFPLRVDGFHWNTGGINFATMGYFEVPTLVPGWNGAEKPIYGLSFTLDLGPLSSLLKKGAPKGAIKILAAWNPASDPDGGDVSFGVTLGSGSNGKKEIGIEGVFIVSLSDFGFQKLEMDIDEDGVMDDIYCFFLSHAFLKILNTQLPPGGNFSLVLFVPYNGRSETVSLANLGWFLAYERGEGSSGGGPSGPLSATVTTNAGAAVSQGATLTVSVSVSYELDMMLDATVRTEVVPVVPSGTPSFGSTASRPLPPAPQRLTKTIPAGTSGSYQFTWRANQSGNFKVVAYVTTSGGTTAKGESASFKVNSVEGNPKKKAKIIHIDYLGVGSRVTIPFNEDEAELRDIKTVDQMIGAMKSKMPIQGTGTEGTGAGVGLPKQLTTIYRPNGGLLIGFDITILEIFRLAVIFAQENQVYGALIGFSAKAPAFIKGFQFQILYKPINEDIGVFHMLLTLPDYLRRWNIGQGTLTLPIIGLDIYTNGNFRLDLGFPYNFDFSRSLSFEIIVWVMGVPIPLLWSIGLYFAYLTGATSRLVPVLEVSAIEEDDRPMFDPVFEAGLGIRFGLGKEMNYGPLKAGATISLVAMLEGAMAWYWPNGRTGAGTPDLTRFPDWFRVKGQAGIIGHIYGYADFKVVKASVDVELRAIFTFVFETYKDILFGITLSVSVSASITIAFIELSFSFSMEFTFNFAIPNPMGPAPWNDYLQSSSASVSRRLQLARLQQVDPILWDSSVVVFGAPVAALQLYFTPALTSARLGDGARAQGVALLTIERSGDPGTVGQLVEAFTLWAIFLHLGGSTDTGQTVTLADLEELEARLNPQPVTGGELGVPEQMIPYATLVEFIQTNFVGANGESVVISPAPASGDTIQGVIFPMIPDMSIEWDTDGAPGTRNFKDYNTFQPKYHEDLSDYFKLLAVDVLDKTVLGQTRELQQNPPDPASMAETAFEDYFEMLIKGGVAQVMTWARANLERPEDALPTDPDPTAEISTILRAMRGGVNPGELVPGSPFDSVAGMNSRYFAHGLRMPDEVTFNDGALTDVERSDMAMGLYELTGQQVPMPENVGITASFGIEVNPEGQSWITTTGILEWESGLFGDEINAYNNIETVAGIYDPHQPNGVQAPTPIAPLRSQQTMFAFKPSLEIERPQGAPAGHLYPLSDVLLRRLKARMTETPTPLTVFNEGDAATPMGSTSWTWALRIPFTARQIRRTVTTTTGDESSTEETLVPNTYEIGGTDEQTRDIIGAYLNHGGGAGVVGVDLYYNIYGQDGILIGQNQVGSHSAGIMKTNLSTVSAPQQISPLAFEGQDEYSAALDAGNAARALRLIWEASIVNAPGYYLYYDNGDGNAENSALPEEAFQGAENRAYLSLVVRYDAPNPGINALSIQDAGFVEGNLFAELTGELSYSPTLAPGAVAFEMKRDKPTVLPGDHQSELENLFSLLSYWIMDNDDFVSSIHGLPVGPLVDEASDPANPSWIYRQGIKVFNNLKNGAAPGTASRYDAVGRDVLLGMEFLDIYGNRLPAGDEGHPQLEIPVRYTDPLTAIGTWPGIGLQYEIMAGGTLRVTISFEAQSYRDDLNPGYYEPGELDQFREELENRREAAHEQYLKVREQLDGPSVVVTMGSSIDPNNRAPKTAEIYGLVNDIITFFATDPTAPGAERIFRQLDMSIGATNPANIFPIRVDLTVERTAHVHDEAVENLPEAAKAATAVPPIAEVGTSSPSNGTRSGTWTPPDLDDPYTPLAQPEYDDEDWTYPENAWEGDDQPTAHTQFATDFEATFGGFKVATGLGADGPHTLWAVRIGQGSSAGLGYTFGAAPSYFAPAPLSRTLQSREGVPIRTDSFDPAEPEQNTQPESFFDVDLDIWAREFLEAVDRFLEPEYAVTARQIAQTPYTQIVEAKERIAEAIAGDPDDPAIPGSVTHVLEVGDTGPAAAAVAREAYRQQLLRTLSSAYDVETAVVFPVSTSNNQPTAEDMAPRIYGNVFGERANGGVFNPQDPDPESDFLFTPSKVDLSGQQEYLATLFSAERALNHAAAELHVSYRVSHIEHDLRETDDEGYQASSWLALVLSENDPSPLTQGPVDIPIALRQYPEEPSLLRQNGVAVHPNSATTLAEAKLWNYRYALSQTALPQDTLFSIVDFNVDEEANLRNLQQGDLNLVDWLARFKREYPLFLNDLDQLALGARGLEVPDAAIRAVQWFSNIVVGVSNVWSDWIVAQNQLSRRLQQTALLPYEWEYQITEFLEGGQAHISLNASTDNGAFPPQIPDIEVVLENDSPSRLSSGDGQYSYPWSGEALPSPRPRTIFIQNLDVLNTENAWASLHLKRNLNLTSPGNPARTTNPRFVYETPETRFVNKTTPLLDTIVPINIYPDGPPKSRHQHLVDMLTELFDTADAGGNTIVRLLKLGVKYAYDVRGQEGPAEGPDQLDEFIAYMPVLQRMPFEITPNAGGIQEFVTALDGEIQLWLETIDPSRARAYYEFDVSIFAALSRTDRPVLRLRRLWLGLNHIS